MPTPEVKLNLPLTPEALAALGGGVVGYVKAIAGADATKMLGGQLAVPPDAELYCLYNANGMPISISPSYEAAVGNALEHDLVPASVH